MTQVFTVMIAVWLLEAHRYAWGIPALLLAIAGLAGLFAPSQPAGPGAPGASRLPAVSRRR